MTHHSTTRNLPCASQHATPAILASTTPPLATPGVPSSTPHPPSQGNLLAYRNKPGAGKTRNSQTFSPVLAFSRRQPTCPLRINKGWVLQIPPEVPRYDIDLRRLKAVQYFLTNHGRPLGLGGPANIGGFYSSHSEGQTRAERNYW